jgi:peptidoglycan/xylan/chitin deacetylase (PgdA/CDA1 family)
MQPMIEYLQKDPKIWDLFSRREEYNSPFRDRFDRFGHYDSSCRNILDPLASKYLIEHGYQVEYPNGKPFAVCLTHDIDHIYSPISFKAISAIRNLKRGSLSGCAHSIAQMRSKKIPFWNFKEIIALEEKFDAKSTFYFMAENLEDVAYDYEIDDCEQALGFIVDHNCEVGLHGGHNSYCNPNDLKSKKARLEKILNKKVVGYRNHYLRFRVPDTWEYLKSSGFIYDSTLGYADCIGFRNGMCHPFKPYNLTSQKEIDIIEIPLTIMDCTFYQYMDLDIERAWERTRYLIDIVEKYHGVLTVLWHNTNFSEEDSEVYKRILKYCEEKNAWMTNGEEIANWVIHGN